MVGNNYYDLVGECVSIELFVMRITGSPADADTTINVTALHPSPTTTDATTHSYSLPVTYIPFTE